MSKRNREIELKLRVTGASYKEAKKALERCIEGNFTISGFSKDLYWKAVNEHTADFIRLRFHSKKKGEITVKHQDNNTVEDRVEIDLDTENPNQAKTLLERLLGPPIGSIEKRYFVLFFDNHNNISVYYLPKEEHVYLEIEMTSKKKLNAMYKALVKAFPYKISKVNKSLFDLYINV